MNTAGIVAEYNPFHNGHKFHIEKTRQKTGVDCIAVVLSGSFTQRCEPAVMSKWARAKTAVLSGVDVVFELPFSFSTASAEGFARGAVGLFNALKCVDIISFGSENGDIKELNAVKEVLLSDEIDEKIKLELKKGVTYASARQKAAADILGAEETMLLKSPNNILAVEYLKALSFFSSSITPFTIQRTGTGYHDKSIKGSFASASHIRGLIMSGSEDFIKAMPQSAAEILKEEYQKGLAPANLNRLERDIIAKIRSIGEKGLVSVPEVSEGLEKRIFKAAMDNNSLENILNAAKTKRYTMSRLRRIVLWAYLDVKSKHLCDFTPYIRVLAFNDKGREFLRLAGKKSKIPIITKAADAYNCLSQKGKNIFDLEAKATDIWGLCTPEIQKGGLDFTNSPIYIS